MQPSDNYRPLRRLMGWRLTMQALKRRQVSRVTGRGRVSLSGRAGGGEGTEKEGQHSAGSCTHRHVVAVAHSAERYLRATEAHLYSAGTSM